MVGALRSCVKIVKTITKDEILEALDTEPLRAGAWFHDPFDGVGRDRLKTCSVCAVGAVIRKASFLMIGVDPVNIANQLVRDNVGLATSVKHEFLETIHDKMDDGHWMLALSNIFETLEDGNLGMATDETRLGCQLFVEGYFPDKIELVYDGNI